MSLIKELQIEASKDDANIESLLRKAYLVSRKLGLEDFSKVIHQELNGYEDINNLPNYRVIKGILRGFNSYNGWTLVMVPHELETALLLRRLIHPIAELNVLYNSNEDPLIIGLTADINEQLSNIFEGPPTVFYVAISRASIYGLLDKIKTLILSWALDLECAGIIGEGVEFSLKEIETAKSTPQIYNYTNNFYGNIDTSQIQQGTTDSHMKI